MSTRAPLPLRPYQLDREGLVNVPRYVSRVESSGWRGWQVRWPGLSKFFSDRVYGSATASLDAAGQFAQLNYPTRNTTARPDVGIALVKIQKPGRSGIQVYVVAYPPTRGSSPRRLYAGMEGSTATPERIQRRWQQAQALREQWIAERQAAASSFYGRSPQER